VVILFYGVTKRHHSYGCKRSFRSLVSQFSTGTVTCLSLVVGGQQTIDKRDIECQVKIHGSLGYPLADEVKMACFSLKEAPQQNNGIKSADVG